MAAGTAAAASALQLNRMHRAIRVLDAQRTVSLLGLDRHGQRCMRNRAIVLHEYLARQPVRPYLASAAKAGAGGPKARGRSLARTNCNSASSWRLPRRSPRDKLATSPANLASLTP